MRAPTFGQCHSSTWPGAGFLATDEIRSLGKGEQPRLQRSRADLGDIAVPSLAWRLCAKRSDVAVSCEGGPAANCKVIEAIADTESPIRFSYS